MRAANVERDARHDAEMAAIREGHHQGMQRLAKIEAVVAQNSAAITRLEQAQNRTNQEVSTLKGWGLELYCERNPGLFAKALGMIREELVPKREMRIIAHEAELSGVINADQFDDLSRADLFLYARRRSDLMPFCLVVEASFRVGDEDVHRAVARAGILSDILQKYQPRNLNGQVMATVAGTHISNSAKLLADNLRVGYVQIQNGNQLSNPQE